MIHVVVGAACFILTAGVVSTSDVPIPNFLPIPIHVPMADRYKPIPIYWSPWVLQNQIIYCFFTQKYVSLCTLVVAAKTV